MRQLYFSFDVTFTDFSIQIIFSHFKTIKCSWILVKKMNFLKALYRKVIHEDKEINPTNTAIEFTWEPAHNWNNVSG